MKNAKLVIENKIEVELTSEEVEILFSKINNLSKPSSMLMKYSIDKILQNVSPENVTISIIFDNKNECGD